MSKAPVRKGTPSRTKARRRALDLLFEADARGIDPIALLDERLADKELEPPVPAYAAELVRGVVARRDRIDEILQTYSTGWTLPRMPNVDREVLRIGAWELLYSDDVPDDVAIDEAVKLVRDLSTDDSPAFVNGLLGRIKDLKPTLLD